MAIKKVETRVRSKIRLDLMHDLVLVEVEKAPDKTTIGIVLPERSREHTRTGVVVAVGPGTTSIMGERLPTKTQVDQRVMFDHASGTLVTFEGKEYVLLREVDVFAILRDKE